MLQPISFDSDVKALLEGANLLADDLAGNTQVKLFGGYTGGKLSSLVGLEGGGANVLLRSLVVSEITRNRGVGRSLVAYAEQQAKELGAQRIYLLTTTERIFFEHLGYRVMDREGAPDTITSTAQFSKLCPDSAHLMIRHLHR